ncbi:MAG: hypothetical protein WCR69_05005 [Sulfuricurvum sp.]|jgi:hypothetical protein
MSANQNSSNQKSDNKSYKEAKKEYLKYRGSFTGGANAEQNYDEHRIKKYGN